MEHLHRQELQDQNADDDKLKPRFFDKLFPMERVEQKEKIFEHIEHHTAENDRTDQFFHG